MEQSLTVGVREGARLLGVGIVSLYTAIQAGNVPVIRIGRRIRIPRTTLERIAENPERFSREVRSRRKRSA